MNATLTRSSTAVLAAAVGLGLFAAPVLAQESKPTTPPATQNETPAADKADEKAEVIMDEKSKDLYGKMLEAMGGKKEIEGIKSGHAKMTMSAVGAPMEITTDSYWMGEKFLFDQQVAGMNMSIGYDGTIGWILGPPQMGGSKIMSAEQIEQAKGQGGNTFLLLPLRIKDEATSISYAGTEEFNGADAHKLTVVLRDEEADGSEDEGRTQYMFVNPETNLLAGISGTQDSPNGPVEFTLLADDYREVSGLKFPHKLTMTQGPQAFNVTFNAIELNNVEASRFDPPAEIKELTGGGAGADEGADDHGDHDHGDHDHDAPDGAAGSGGDDDPSNPRG